MFNGQMNIINVNKEYNNILTIIYEDFKTVSLWSVRILLSEIQFAQTIQISK